jgi:hypothetical protein
MKGPEASGLTMKGVIEGAVMFSYLSGASVV